MSASELVCQLSSALEGGSGEEGLPALLQELAGLVDTPGSGSASELDEILMDAWPLVMAAAGRSAAAEAAARPLLAAVARHCTAREVFTLCMATLAEHLSEAADAPEGSHAYGPASPAFQLCLLRALQQCLPRIRRRPLHFFADLLHTQLRWAGEVLPKLPLGSVSNDASTGQTPTEQPVEGPATLTVASASHALANWAGNVAAWAGGQQLAEHEWHAALQLQGATLLHLASLCLQLPQNVEAAAAAAAAAQRQQQGQRGAGTLGAAPAAGSRLPLMRAAAVALLALPQVLIAAVPFEEEKPGSSSSSSSTASPEHLQQLAEGLGEQLATAGIDAADLAHLSPAQAAEGAAAAACAAACNISTPPDAQAEWLQDLLPAAACLLLDLGAQQQSVPLALLPLCAVCTACSQVAGTTAAGGQGAAGREPAAATPAPAASLQLAASTPALDTLLSALVAIMSHNPVQLLRSCAHDALHAVLDAFRPAARLAQLHRLLQSPSTAAAVVTLQRLRQEVAAAWGATGGTSAGTAGSSAASAPPVAAPEASDDRGIWLSSEALGLALPCLQRGSEDGWHDEASVLAAADVQAAALSLLRWVLLRERTAPRGLLPPQHAAALLRDDLLPLRVCAERVLQLQAAQGAGGAGAGGAGGSGTASAAEEQQRLDAYLAVQRLHEALGCVVDLLRDKHQAA
ncbi:hypothetical protein ABPG75_002544 [Micractinium tetrahymenae]